jgi:hypothetical protein
VRPDLFYPATPKRLESDGTSIRAYLEILDSRKACCDSLGKSELVFDGQFSKHNTSKQGNKEVRKQGNLTKNCSKMQKSGY